MGFGTVLKKMFPFISAAAGLGGPLGSMAANAVGKAIGADKIGNTTEGIADAIAAATSKDPDAMLKLKQAEEEFQLSMTKLGFDSVEKLAEIAAADRASARSREIAVKDKVPMILAITVTAGFFSLLWLLAFHTVPTPAHDLLLMMLGSLGTAWISIISYYFGSSAGSSDKNRIIENFNAVGK